MMEETQYSEEQMKPSCMKGVMQPPMMLLFLILTTFSIFSWEGACYAAMVVAVQVTMSMLMMSTTWSLGSMMIWAMKEIEAWCKIKMTKFKELFLRNNCDYVKKVSY